MSHGCRPRLELAGRVLVRDPDVDKQARQWAEKIEKDHGLTNQHYSKILTKRQMEREYHTFAQKRALASTYDVFLVDVRVGKAVRSFLGTEFYKVHKEPLDFKYTKPLVTSIESAVKTVVLKLQRYATRVNVCFGHLGQQLSDLSSNFDAVVDAVIDACPGGFSNIRSIYVQPVGSSPSLPVYVDNGATSEVHLEKPEKRRRCLEEVIDECSTLPEGLKLAVRKNGKLRVMKEDSGYTVLYPTVHDEWEERDGLKPTVDPAKLKRKHALKKKRMQKRLTQKKIKSGEPFVYSVTMSMPWYYLEKPTRMILLRCYYAVCAFTYPVFVGLNWKSYAPTRAEVLAGRSLKDEILRPTKK
ncbi:hypothetical protein COOONC_23479 [Cooperia oncophora]